MQIRPAEAELFHAIGQTDMTKLILAFRNFVKTPPPLPPQKKIDELTCSLLHFPSRVRVQHLIRRLQCERRHTSVT